MSKAAEGTVNWYALKVFWNKVFEVELLLAQDGCESYIPCRKVIVESGGVKKEERKTLIPSLMFFRATEQYACDFQSRLVDKIMLYSYLDRNNVRHPSPVPEHDMRMFMLVTSAGDDGLECFPEEYMRYKVGEKVRVTGGIFKGAEGYIKRIKHNRRLTVTLTGVCMVATSYIEPFFLEKID